jgi:hypothetical protein
MKARILAALAATAVIATAAAAQAKALTPGYYNADGLQTICLVSGGTWYSPSYGAGWAGQWQVINGDTHIIGNYLSGEGNDSIIVGKSKTWDEWHDDLSYVNLLDPITFTRISPRCPDSSAAGAVSGANPTQR